MAINDESGQCGKKTTRDEGLSTPKRPEIQSEASASKTKIFNEDVTSIVETLSNAV